MLDATTITLGMAMPELLLGKQIQKKIKSEIILGSPSSMCQGVGICRVMAFGEMPVCPCQKVTAWLMLSETGKLRISFLKSEMEPKFLEKHFKWMVFQVQETYRLPHRMARALGLRKSSVQAGVYFVRDSSRFLTVDL